MFQNLIHFIDTPMLVNFDFIFAIGAVFLVIFFFSLIVEENIFKVKFLFILTLTFIFINVFLMNWNIQIPSLPENSLTLLKSLRPDPSESTKINQIIFDTIPQLELFIVHNFAILLISTLLCLFLVGFCDKFLIKSVKDFEFLWLILLFYFSAIVLLLSTHLMEIFIFLECISFCSYILIGLNRLNKLSALSGIRYLILSAIPSSMFILGSIYLYENYGTLVKYNIEAFLASSTTIQETAKVFIPESTELKYIDFPTPTSGNIIWMHLDGASGFFAELFDRTHSFAGNVSIQLFGLRNPTYGYFGPQYGLPEYARWMSRYLNFAIQELPTTFAEDTIAMPNLDKISTNLSCVIDKTTLDEKNIHALVCSLSHSELDTIEPQYSELRFRKSIVKHIEWMKLKESLDAINHYNTEPIHTVFFNSLPQPKVGEGRYTSPKIQLKEFNTIINFAPTGKFNFTDFISDNIIKQKYVFVSLNIAVILIIINFSFKITAAPFHVWAPIIYNNGPITSVAFLAIFTKLVLLLFILMFFTTTFYFIKSFWSYIWFGLGLFSIIVGMLGALGERYIKKFFIYSSMSDVGFMLIGLSFYTESIYKFIFNYLFLYNLSTIFIWLVLLYIKTKTKFIVNLQQILWNDMLLKILFSLNIFSLAGIPPFGGFFVKLDILMNMFFGFQTNINLFILLLTVINFFYYLRLIKVIFFSPIKHKITDFQNYIFDFKLFNFSFLTIFIFLFCLFMQNSFIYILSYITGELV